MSLGFLALGLGVVALGLACAVLKVDSRSAAVFVDESAEAVAPLHVA